MQLTLYNDGIHLRPNSVKKRQHNSSTIIKKLIIDEDEQWLMNSNHDSIGGVEDSQFMRH